MHDILLVSIGLVAGTLGGLMGIGGGIIMIPALIYLAGFTQLQAQGTTLAAMIPPIGLLAAWVYYRQGAVNIPAAVLICCGFFVGGFIGAKIAGSLSPDLLRKIFGSALLLIALHLLFFRR
jgi:uncharacterized membrane protein YfcA